MMEILQNKVTNKETPMLIVIVSGPVCVRYGVEVGSSDSLHGF